MSLNGNYLNIKCVLLTRNVFNTIHFICESSTQQSVPVLKQKLHGLENYLYESEIIKRYPRKENLVAITNEFYDLKMYLKRLMK